MNDEDLVCRWCKRKLTNIESLGEAMISIIVGHCKHCDSEQVWYTNGKVLSWQFKVGAQYSVKYIPEKKLLIIEDFLAKKSKSRFELKTKEAPDYITPESMTEERIKTIIVFS